MVGEADYISLETPLEKVLRLHREAGEIMKDRTLEYDDSWIEEGFDGLVYDIKRKYRRIFFRVIIQKQPPHKDDCFDLSNYALMLAGLEEIAPEKVERIGKP